MLRRLYRQRRRIAVTFILASMALALSFVDNPEMRLFMKHEMAGPFWLNFVSLGLAVAIVSIVGSAVLILLWPAARVASELSALTYLLVEAGRFAIPVLPAWMVEGSAHLWWWPAIYFSLVFLRESAFLDRLSPKLPLHSRARRKINATPEAIWAVFAPDADNLGTYWNGGLTRVDPMPGEGDNVFEARFTMGKFGALIQRHDRKIWNKPLHFLYDFTPETGGGFSGSCEMLCEPLEDGWCRVTITHVYPGISFGMWSLLWLDDMVRDEMDGVVATMRGRRDWSIGGWAARKIARPA